MACPLQNGYGHVQLQRYDTANSPYAVNEAASSWSSSASFFDSETTPTAPTASQILPGHDKLKHVTSTILLIDGFLLPTLPTPPTALTALSVPENLSPPPKTPAHSPAPFSRAQPHLLPTDTTKRSPATPRLPASLPLHRRACTHSSTRSTDRPHIYQQHANRDLTHFSPPVSHPNVIQAAHASHTMHAVQYGQQDWGIETWFVRSWGWSTGRGLQHCRWNQ